MPAFPRPDIIKAVATILEVEELARKLSEKQRAELAAQLLESLPAILSDDDEGYGEARRRDDELEAEHSLGITAAQLDKSIAARSRA